MRCLLCGSLSWHSICKECLDGLSPNTPTPRLLENGLKVYSFFTYSHIAPLLHVKHLIHGSKVYERLAKVSFQRFAKNLEFQTLVKAIPIDDNVRSGYSHTAILAKYMKSYNIQPVFGVLRATNKVNYSGKSLAYRKSNPRKFTCKLKEKSDVILIDDIVT